MSAYALEFILKDILRGINPSSDDWSKRYQIIQRLRTVVQSVESLQGATVEPFGSFASNLFTRWGDLDLSIELHNGSYISAFAKKSKVTLLKDIQKALRRSGNWQGLQLVSNARVPILKTEACYPNISCDISINNLNGQMKSKLLFWINEIDGRFRDMVLLVKEWAKAQGINDSKSGTLNSYSLSLLVIFHFQTCVPALLPPLKEIYPGNLADDLTGVRDVAEKHIEEICAENINKFRSDRSRARNLTCLSELFVSFLAKFSDIDSRASHQGICPSTGQWEPIEGKMRWLPKTYALFVEDPFEQPANSARTVSSGQLTRIAEAFQTTHRILMSPNQNQKSIVATLVRSQVSLTFVGAGPSCSNAYSHGFNGTHHQAQRTTHSSAQVHRNQVQQKRLSKVIVQRPPSTPQSQGQGQRVWRPTSQ